MLISTAEWKLVEAGWNPADGKGKLRLLEGAENIKYSINPLRADIFKGVEASFRAASPSLCGS